MSIASKYNQAKGEIQKQSGQPLKGAFSKLKGRLQEITEDVERKNRDSAL